MSYPAGKLWPVGVASARRSKRPTFIERQHDTVTDAYISAMVDSGSESEALQAPEPRKQSIHDDSRLFMMSTDGYTRAWRVTADLAARSKLLQEALASAHGTRLPLDVPSDIIQAWVDCKAYGLHLEALLGVVKVCTLPRSYVRGAVTST